MSLWKTTGACALALAITAPLAGCGKMGQLERPGPLNGVATATTKGSDEAVRQATDPDRSIDPRPPRTLPIEGTSPDPNRVALPGALPDPYANPR